MKKILLIIFLSEFLFSYNSITRATYSAIEVSSGSEYSMKVHFIYNYEYNISEKIIYLMDDYYFIIEREFPSKEYEEFRKNKKSFLAFLKILFKFFDGGIEKKLKIDVGNNIKTLHLDCKYKTPTYNVICQSNKKKFNNFEIFKFINTYFSDKKMDKLLNVISWDKNNILSRYIFSDNIYKKGKYKFVEKFILCNDAEGSLNYDCSKWKDAEILENCQTIIIK